ncbi:MAG: preprotein translocase subunit SecE [Desulfobacteraceae bacterium]
MGRLQRKKDPNKKKSKSIKDQDTGALPEESDSASGGVKKAAVQVKKAPISIAKSTAAKKEKNFIDKSLQFLREVKIELKKVTWPSKKQTMGSTAVVIVLVMIISLFLGLVDGGLSSLVKIVLQ